MKSLSIIIPMYNVAPYVERCIRSLENQDLSKDEYEVICINDGSPDNSKAIVEKLQIEYSNIILIDQENQGVSRARNNGIDKATGKYLLFVDPDDYVDLNSFSRILNSIDDSKSQVSFLGFSFLNADGSLHKTWFNTEQKGAVFAGLEAYFLSRGNGRTDPDRIWAVLFEREFIIKNELLFLSGVPYLEDGELIARIMCLAERCIFDGHSFYQRTARQGSATHSKLYNSEKASNGFMKSALNLKNFQANDKLSADQKKFLNQPIAKFIFATLYSSISDGKISRYFKTYKTLKEKGLSKCKLSGCRNRYKIECHFYNLSPYIYLPFKPVLERVLYLLKL